MLAAVPETDAGTDCLLWGIIARPACSARDIFDPAGGSGSVVFAYRICSCEDCTRFFADSLEGLLQGTRLCAPRSGAVNERCVTPVTYASLNSSWTLVALCRPWLAGTADDQLAGRSG